MKIAGRELKRNTDYVVFKRLDGNIVFTVEAILNYDDFKKYCPNPVPPIRQYPDGRQVQDTKDENYLRDVESISSKRMAWTILKSIASTPGLEFSSIKMDEPNTWLKWEDEFREAGFTNTEIMYLATKIYEINGMSAKAMEEARESFLADMAANQS